jgi:hypothetical protein
MRYSKNSRHMKDTESDRLMQHLLKKDQDLLISLLMSTMDLSRLILNIAMRASSTPSIKGLKNFISMPNLIPINI